MACCRIHQTIYLWKWVIVFRARLIQVREVDAHPPLAIWFFYQDNVG